jgi:hypothetical protein
MNHEHRSASVPKSAFQDARTTKKITFTNQIDWLYKE